MTIIPEHKHTASLFVRCLRCLQFGNPTPKEADNLEGAAKCPYCGSLATVKYYPACCMLQMKQIKETKPHD